MLKVSIHMKSGKTITMFCKSFSSILTPTGAKITWDGMTTFYAHFNIETSQIEAVTAKKLAWYDYLWCGREIKE